MNDPWFNQGNLSFDDTKNNIVSNLSVLNPSSIVPKINIEG
jgi:hypothetical protein